VGWLESFKQDMKNRNTNTPSSNVIIRDGRYHTYKTMGDFQRALVFQGGGALGAYEAGTYQQMYKKVSKESTDGRLFDIVAGTSIGAINSSVLVGHYLKNKSWEVILAGLLGSWILLSVLTLQYLQQILKDPFFPLEMLRTI
jgi:predicted acylesterase/phospholipase RssA